MKHMLVCLIAAALVCSSIAATSAAPTVIDSFYRADVPFPQFERYWHATSALAGPTRTTPLGGVLYVYVRNDASKPVEVVDVLMEGVSLSKAVAFSHARTFRKWLYAASIHFSKLPKAQIDTVKRAGEPIWWRFQPTTLKPGECGELIVRVRRNPLERAVKLTILTRGGSRIAATCAVGPVVPRFQTIAFSPARDTVYLYVQHPKPGMTPSKLTMDGQDVTSGCSIISDPNGKLVPVICRLKNAVGPASLHCFQALYPDGSKATASLKAFAGDFAFGMWGAPSGEADQLNIGRDWVNDLALHNFNVQMEMVGSAAVREYYKTAEAHAQLKSLGIGRMMYNPLQGGLKECWGFFLADEPDCGDSRVEGVPNEAKVGSLCQGLTVRQDDLHAQDPLAPGIVNMDFTYRPFHWYIYGQVADVLASDPYYQARLGQEAEYGKHPEKLNAFKKATYIEGVSTICQSSQAPKPTHIILLAGGGRHEEGTNGATFAPWQEKRIETYYCIGSGAKGISYWWFHNLDKGLQPGAVDPLAAAQWREMGLIGAELRTAGPILSTSCPTKLPVSAPPQLWVRSLVNGGDTVVLVCVNDGYTCSLEGIDIKPMQDVKVSVDLPSWLEPKNVFEINSRGTTDLASNASGHRLNLDLGTVDVTRLIVITSDPGLKTTLQKLYDDKFAGNVAKLLAEGAK